MYHPDGQKEKLEAFRRKLAFRSWHRGTREADLLMGPFADAHLAGFDAGQLAAYDALLGESDPVIYDWLIGRARPDNAEFARLIGMMQNFKNIGQASE